MSINYAVVVEQYAGRHFISGFKKKYKGAWNVTWIGMHEQLKRIDALIDQTNLAEIITHSGEIRICKTEFRIHNTKESPHSSGNRCIVAVHKNTETVHILLVYGKTHLGNRNETAKWKNLIRENYPQYSKII